MISSRATAPWRTGNPLAAGSLGVVLWVFSMPAAPAEVPAAAPIKLAVFDFELEDLSPAAPYIGKITSSAENLGKVSQEARRVLAESGRYTVVDVSHVDDKPVKDRSLRHCDGCEAAIALQLGADQSLVGVVTRVTQTDYYLQIQIRDARTGKILDEQEANFAGSDEGWASGVRMLIKHQVLASQN